MYLTDREATCHLATLAHFPVTLTKSY